MEQLTLQCNVAPNDLYLTENETAYLNKFQLTLITHTVASQLPIPPVSLVNGMPAITLTCDWVNPLTGLCMLDEAMDVLLECDGWTILWKERGWLLKPPQYLDLSKGFTATLLISNLISTTLEGTALLNLCLFNFPGFAPCAPFIATLEKRYPIKIILFQAQPQKLEIGEAGTLHWSVINCRDCYLGGQTVKPLDSKEINLINEAHSFFLTAYNEFGRSAAAELTVYPTNWRALGTVASDILPLGKERSHCNCKIHLHNGQFYLLSDAKLYKTESLESLSWSICAEVPIPVGMPDFYDTVVLQDVLWVVGEKTVLQYSFTDKRWNTSTVELRTHCHTACRVCTFQNELVYSSVLGKTKLIFARHKPEKDRWERNWFLNVVDSMTEIGAFDLTEFHGVLYAAVQDREKKQIFIYISNDLDDWKLWGKRNIGGDWFHLLHANERLFLLTSGKMIDLGGGMLFKDFPEFPDMSRFPFACSGEKQCYLATFDTVENYFYRFTA